MAKANISSETLKQILHYNPKTGLFTRITRSARAVQIGDVAGSMTDRGYIEISVLNTRYRAHRLAFLYMSGAWPEGEVDHINGKRDDNRWVNLREGSLTKNRQNIRRAQENNLFGLLGVYLGDGPNPWRARITVNKKCIHLGSFRTKESAHAAYLAAKRELHQGCTI